ncbi:unnamed protein product [Didymodactylos carnosus]|uniref:Peptidase S1 domain-containing protein n=1 Tax=Didymodactylos carnosus TaxID=1234261 RepID=A0A814NNU3_9BILA|nr:unnamed protein product [Didymodactylos carnosus]CAF1095471.1 unnamed protein product [Didymodactylos carnosus]CAF3733555.1 unnamed protein product [Didymodactylos carnosus]CAF3860830.1 unnamed protein product [Didymodactylos carnosus]
MQNQQFASLDHIVEHNNINLNLKSASLQEPQQKHGKVVCGAIALFIIVLLLVIALVISIALVFTIGVKATRSDESSNTANSTSTILPVSPLFEPCNCGCPSVEPLFSDETAAATARIVNGETARAHSWPWQILLVMYDPETKLEYRCGATLLTQRHVLTAAHCVHGFFPPYMVLFSGQHARNLSISLIDVRVVNKVYIHESYNSHAHNDLAILTTEEPFRFDTYVSPICLATPNSLLLQANEELVAIGWGRISGQPETFIYPEYLQQVKVAYVPASNCSRILEPTTVLHPGQMCAGRPGHNACSGDSGGPLMRRMRLANTGTYYWQQMGVASLSKDCGWNSTWPDIYVNIPYYYDWIMATVKRAV